MSRQNLPIVIMVVSCIALHATGCTVVGFTLGVVADKNRPNYDTLHAWQVEELGGEDSVAITCDSDTIVAGSYLGLEKTSSEQYKAAYAAWQMTDSAGLLFPSLDDTVAVERTSPLRANIGGTLFGFDPGVICVQVESDIERVGVEGVRNVTSSRGKVIPGETLRNWLSRGRIPFMSALRVRVGADTLRVPLCEVSEIQKTNPKNQAWKGLLAGVAFDVLIFAGLSSSLSGGFAGGE
jgi:hypothetical protein